VLAFTNRHRRGPVGPAAPLAHRAPGSRRLLMAGVLIAVAIAVTACGNAVVAIDTSAPAVVHMTEFAFTPNAITMPRDSRVTVVNDGKMDHTWTVTKVALGTGVVAPGASVVVDLTGVAPGTYAVVCDQPGHAAAGQTGTLTITG
jgi:plastocyanin